MHRSTPSFPSAALADLRLEERKLVMFGGKGGVGKTTCASATAIHFADMGKEVLILTSDPTPSLSDIFETKIGSAIRRVPGVENLHALELTYDETIRMWKERYGPEIYEVISSILPVEPDILDYFAGAPGLDEEFMLAYILDLIEQSRYDLVIWDTAPAGHTFSLLRLQARLYSHLTDAAKLYTKLQSYIERLRAIIGIKKEARSPLEIIESWKALADRVFSLLRDKRATDFIVVIIPEALGVYQTDRIIGDLSEYGIDVRCIIINKALQESICTTDFLRSRFSIQSVYMRAIFEKYGREKAIVVVPLLPHEVKGIESLREVERILFERAEAA